MHVRHNSRRAGSRRSLRGLGELGACANGPSVTKAIVTSGTSIGAGIGAALLTGTAIGGPIGTIVGSIVGIVASLIPETSACAKHSPDPETFLKCWGHPIPDDFIPEWDPNKCGWFRWVMCPGARGGHYPAGGCGPCANPAGGAGYSGGKWTCWQGTEIAPGVPAWGNETAPAADVAGGIMGAVSAINPLWVVLGVGGTMLLLRKARHAN